MNKQTKEYREKQFGKVNTLYIEFLPKIKIIKPNGETNWIDITEEELLLIKNILVNK
jgi:hypothetical protein